MHLSSRKMAPRQFERSLGKMYKNKIFQFQILINLETGESAKLSVKFVYNTSNH